MRAAVAGLCCSRRELEPCLGTCGQSHAYLWWGSTLCWTRALFCTLHKYVRLHLCLFVCNHIAFGRWRPCHIRYIFPPRVFRNIKKQKQSRESSSPKTKRKNCQKKQHHTFTPPHHLTPRDLSSPPPPPLR